MRTLLLVTTLALAAGGGMQSRPATDFDPSGRWTYSTLDDSGVQTNGTMTITGKPGAYTGTIVTAKGQEIRISDVYTSATGMVVMAPLEDGGTAVIRVSAKADGKLEAGWAPVRNVIPATVARAK
jgi:hypothetical protein